MRKLWDCDRALLRDHPGATTFSHDTNILALWQGVVPARDRRRLGDAVLALARKPPGRPQDGLRDAADVVPASLYFRYYLVRALDQVGRADAFVGLLGPWRELLGQGLSTFPEFTDPARSDAHVWSAHPAFDLLSVVAGVRPAAPGFRRVRIAPKLGGLRHLDATFPHPQGDIVVGYRVEGARLRARIRLPAGLSGALVWRGTSITLPAGRDVDVVLPR